MTYALQWLRSLIFVFQMYVAIILIMLAYTPLALVDRRCLVALDADLRPLGAVFGALDRRAAHRSAWARSPKARC